MRLPRLTLAAMVMSTAWLLTGCIYSHVRVPMSSEFRGTETVSKSGQATTRSVAWLAAWGDAGLQKAAANGELATIEYADRTLVNILMPTLRPFPS